MRIDGLKISNYRSHPVVSHPRPLYNAKVRTLDEKDKFKKAAALTTDINNFVSNMSISRFDFFIQKLGNFRFELMREFGHNHSGSGMGETSRELVDDTEGFG